MQTFAKCHSDALKSDIVMGGTDATRCDEVSNGGGKLCHFFRNYFLDVRHHSDSLYADAKLAKSPAQEGTISVNSVALQCKNINQKFLKNCFLMTLKETINCAKVETLLHVSMVGKQVYKILIEPSTVRKITAYKI